MNEKEQDCPHYWLIEPADGPTSRGECKYCGAVKDFYNSFPEFIYNRTVLEEPEVDDYDLKSAVTA